MPQAPTRLNQDRWDPRPTGISLADSTGLEHAARAYLQPPESVSGLADCIAFDWNAMDAWFEEDEEIFIHPRDPRHRVDVRESSKAIRVEIDGKTVAETTRPRILFETDIPCATTSLGSTSGSMRS